MLPNRFPDEGQAPEYNTVNATLWCYYGEGFGKGNEGSAARWSCYQDHSRRL